MLCETVCSEWNGQILMKCLTVNMKQLRGKRWKIEMEENERFGRHRRRIYIYI